MKHPLQHILVTLLLAAVILAGCSSSTPAATPTPTPTVASATAPAPTSAPATQSFTLIDGLGRSVELAGPAQKIVSLAPSNTEILFAVGAGPQVVGRDEFSDYPAEAKELPSVGGSFGEYSPEAILALEPDLVLAAEINPPELVQSLEDLGLTVYYLKNPTNLEGMYTNLQIIGAITGRLPEAMQLMAGLQGRVAAVDQKVAQAAGQPLVFYEIDSTDPSAPYTAGPGTFVDLLIQRAGGRSVGSSLASAWAQISAEELLAQNPDIILLGDAAYGVTVESVGQRAGWEPIAAVQTAQIFPFDDNLVSRPGPRLVDGLEQLAQLLHPELFE